jgi:hypothetical protein
MVHILWLELKGRIVRLKAGGREAFDDDDHLLSVDDPDCASTWKFKRAITPKDKIVECSMLNRMAGCRVGRFVDGQDR